MDTPTNVKSLRLRCKNLYRSWWTTHYTIGLIGILSAALLTALSVPNPPLVTSTEGEGILRLSQIRPNAWLLGVIATICGSLVTLLGPLQKAEKYWSSFHILDQAIMELELDLISAREFARKVSGARKVLQIREVTVERYQNARKTPDQSDTDDVSTG